MEQFRTVKRLIRLTSVCI